MPADKEHTITVTSAELNFLGCLIAMHQSILEGDYEDGYKYARHADGNLNLEASYVLGQKLVRIADTEDPTPGSAKRLKMLG